MTVHRIIGVDPGETVGICYLTWDATRNIGGCAAIQEPWKPALQKLRFDLPRSTRVAVEAWRLYGSAAQALIGDDMFTVRIIGRVEEIAFEKGCPFEQHLPDIKEPAWLFLERLGLPVPEGGVNIHAKDAAAQAAWCLRGILYGRE